MLDLEPVPADRLSIEAGRGAGLEPAHAKTQPVQPFRQAKGRGFADAAGRDLALADMDEPAQEGAGGQHHGTRADRAPVSR